MYLTIQTYCNSLAKQFHSIASDRKKLLSSVSDFIKQQKAQNKPVQLVYICTHNSRRSHFGQVWAATAAAYYGISDIYTFSGGTEATAFNQNAIQALKKAGFEIYSDGQEKNPVYQVCYGEEECTTCFSKVYHHPANPKDNFLAIMTCGEAEANCPFIPGATGRIATTYEDPKLYDGTTQQEAVYDERCRQIALETLYVFSLVK
ncbi:MAG: protein-tyrosine-phosphatase [Sphingobacteriales bacterium]|uniref:protein-tyrosine-phosphatase n=1 Tax=Hydrotalea flava TaxID=714549 RepID=UPI0008336674|nr:protein-tyrosine-phosphatase [Hydrotalea flava]RTL53212.1 MAG: protein-tyrosine-phosphatase [Sphingobacteriales bacterium]